MVGENTSGHNNIASVPLLRTFHITAMRKLEWEQKIIVDFLLSSKFARGQNVEKLFALEHLLHRLQNFGTSHQIKNKYIHS